MGRSSDNLFRGRRGEYGGQGFGGGYGGGYGGTYGYNNGEVVMDRDIPWVVDTVLHMVVDMAVNTEVDTALHMGGGYGAPYRHEHHRRW